MALILCALALVRPIDHDESQYVAAAVLTAHGLLPYRDYAYLQTPLQPFLFAPLAWMAGVAAWPALRLANALLGAVALFVHVARRAAGRARPGRAGGDRACSRAATSCSSRSAPRATTRCPPPASPARLWLAVRGGARAG